MENHSERKVDVFTTKGMVPTCKLDGQILLFDNFSGVNPLLPLDGTEPVKLWQMTIFFVEEGKCAFSINNENIILKQGQMLVTHEECVLSFRDATEDIKYFMFVLYPKTVYDTFADIHLNYNKSQFCYSYNVGDVKKQDMEYFHEMYEATKTDMMRPAYKYQINYARCFLNVILTYIINQFHQNADMQADPSSRQYDMFCRFMEELNKHADKERSVQFYASLLGITSKYLSYVCLQYSRRNASTWIDEYVVAKARALQNVHHYSIKRISQELNFISPSSFTRFFKRVTGNPPTKW
jgi:AraC-like DNA-binding protein